MTMTMKALRASARSTPRAPSAAPCDDPDGEGDAQARTRAVRGGRRASRPAAATARRPRHGAPTAGTEEDDVRGASVVQLPELVEVERRRTGRASGARTAARPRQQHVERGAELDQQRHAGGEQERDEAMPLSTSRSPTIWETALRRVTRAKKPISMVASPTGRAAPAVLGHERDDRPLAAKARTVSAAAATSEAGTLTRGAVSRLPGRDARPAQQRGDDDRLWHQDERRGDARPASCEWTPSTAATTPSATPWTASGRTIARRSRRHSVTTAHDEHGAGGEVERSAIGEPLIGSPAR